MSESLDMFNKNNGATLFAIREQFASNMLPCVRGFTDANKLTLVLLGGTGASTGMHLDYTCAQNVAYTVEGATENAVADWLFVAPNMIEVADLWLKQLVGANGRSLFPDGFATYGRVLLTGEVQQRFVQEMNVVCPNSVTILAQQHGEVMYVPPGYVHQVINRQMALKVAWDYYDVSHMGVYPFIHNMASKYFKQNMTTDYAYVNAIVEAMLEKKL